MREALRNRLPLLLATAGGIMAGGGAIALTDRSAGGSNQSQLEQSIHDYILNHPEIIREAMKRLQDRDTEKLLADNRVAIETPFSGAWAGAEKPDLTVVMFTDYSCGYCRASVPDVDRLLAEDKKLRIVWREIPILGPGSEAAARGALAAARQGRYLDFHRRMFAEGPPDEAHVARVAKEIGLSAAIHEGGAIDREIDSNLSLMRALGISGTPSFVVGGKMMQGAVGYDALKQAVALARKSPA